MNGSRMMSAATAGGSFINVRFEEKKEAAACIRRNSVEGGDSSPRLAGTSRGRCWRPSLNLEREDIKSVVSKTSARV